MNIFHFANKKLQGTKMEVKFLLIAFLATTYFKKRIIWRIEEAGAQPLSQWVMGM